MKRHGSFVPGIRPGRPTAEYLDKIMGRLTLVGALALTAIALFPVIVNTLLDVPYIIASFMGGTALIILVGVALDTVRQIESHLLMRHYDGFMKRGRIRGR
jgi:preprotein translocase subunit SecY